METLKTHLKPRLLKSSRRSVIKNIAIKPKYRRVMQKFLKRIGTAVTKI